MKSKKQRPNIHLSQTDLDAILCALPLISYFDAGSDRQNQINDALMMTAAEKLSSRNTNLVPNEYRVIYTAVALAVNLENFLPESAIDPEWRQELKQHFFALNRIHELTKDQIYE